MPTYNFKCPKCKGEGEFFCKISERESAAPLCPLDCKDDAGQPVKTELSFTTNNEGNFVLKGRGWYKDGY